MGQKEKLILKLCSNPKTFSYDELKTLLGHFGYKEENKGRTSGSRVKFVNNETGEEISLHKPHTRKELLDYQVKQVTEHLKNGGLV